MDTIELDDLEKVNTFSRVELMKSKTRELTGFVSAFINSDRHVKFIKMLEVFEHLALDWVNSGDIDWDDSLPDQQAKKILAELGPTK